MSLQNLLSKLRQKTSHLRESFDLRSFKTALFQKISLERIFKPTSISGIRRLQFFWAGVILLAFLGAFYSVLILFFHQKPALKVAEEKKEVPTLIETMSRKVDLNEVLRHKVEGEIQKLSEEISALKVLFQESLHQEREKNAFNSPQDSPLQDDKDMEIPNAYVHELEAKISQLERRLENPLPTIQRENNPSFSQNSEEEERNKRSIQKFSLGLTENPKHKTIKTVETTILVFTLEIGPRK